MQGNWSRSIWKKQVTLSAEYLLFLEVCDHLPLSNCLLSVGMPARHWHSTLGLPALTRLNNFRIRLLVGCDGLEADASRFRYCHLPSIPLSSDICRICKSGSEDPTHFIAHCSGLSSASELLLLTIDDDNDLQQFAIKFLALHVRNFWPLIVQIQEMETCLRPLYSFRKNSCVSGAMGQKPLSRSNIDYIRDRGGTLTKLYTVRCS